MKVLDSQINRVANHCTFGRIVVLLMALVVMPVRAAVITWAQPANIKNDTDVATNGIFIYAETWGSSGATVNGVTFAYDTSKSGDVNVGIALPGSPTGTDNHGEGVGGTGTLYAGLSAAYQVLVKGTVWADVGTVGTVILNNLTVSNLYEVQIWENDSRGSYSTRIATRAANTIIANSTAYVSATFLMGGNDYVTGTFVAPVNGTNPTVNVNLQENLPSSGSGNINALVVRALPSLLLNCVAVPGGQLQLQWSQGALLQATNLNGPWLTNATVSPVSLTPAGAQQFFRVRFQ